MQGATREIFSRRLFFFHGVPMADPLLTDDELAALLAQPVSASDDAGSVTMRSIGDILKAMEFTERRRAVNPHKVLGGLRKAAAHKRDD